MVESGTSTTYEYLLSRSQEREQYRTLQIEQQERHRAYEQREKDRAAERELRQAREEVKKLEEYRRILEEREREMVRKRKEQENQATHSQQIYLGGPDHGKMVVGETNIRPNRWLPK